MNVDFHIDISGNGPAPAEICGETDGMDWYAKGQVPRHRVKDFNDLMIQLRHAAYPLWLRDPPRLPKLRLKLADLGLKLRELDDGT